MREQRFTRYERYEHYQQRLDNLFDATTSGRLKVLNEAHCRLCLRHRDVRPLTRHHLIPLSWWLDQPARIRRIRNANCNIVGLCREDHDFIHDREMGRISRTMLRKVLAQNEIAFIIRIRGVDWLDETYPRGDIPDSFVQEYPSFAA